VVGQTLGLGAARHMSYNTLPVSGSILTKPNTAPFSPRCFVNNTMQPSTSQ
jgi:hypothetical protein